MRKDTTPLVDDYLSRIDRMLEQGKSLDQIIDYIDLLLGDLGVLTMGEADSIITYAADGMKLNKN